MDPPGQLTSSGSSSFSKENFEKESYRHSAFIRSNMIHTGQFPRGFGRCLYRQ